MSSLASTLSIALTASSVPNAVGVAASASDINVPEALAIDDQCSAGDSQCAMNALQMKQKKLSTEANETWGLCEIYGCHGFVVGRPCQCNSKCSQYGNCCPGYKQKCGGQAATDPCYGPEVKWSLDWKAEGKNFFKDWTFVTQDDVHGAHQFVNKSEAFHRGVISTSGDDAFIRVGGIRKPVEEGEADKRYSANLHSDHAWDPKHGMLVMMKYKHLPYGCGLWPGFWTMNSDRVWPKGGEFDMMEYANYEGNLVSYHIEEHCHLDKAKIEQCKPRGSSAKHATKTQDCATDYYKNLMGCRPPHIQKTGKQLSQSPGIIASVWTKDHIIMYHIPEDEIPDDIHNNRPEPATWNKWVMAFLPFKEPCQSTGPQELVLNLQLCGDWAGHTWDVSCRTTGYYAHSGWCDTGLSNPRDCCTQYITSPKRDGQLKRDAFFDINYIKVFTGNGATSKPSGIFLRGGAMLSD